MDISTLSQQLNLSIPELRRRMAEAGFKVSFRARKIDNALAREIIDQLKPKTKIAVTTVEKPKVISLGPLIRVRELADLMNVPVTSIIKLLIQNGVMASLNEQIDFDTAAVVATEFGFEVKEEKTLGLEFNTIAQILAQEGKINLVPRPPIVAVMGHVDHGKTRLLDTIRSSNVAASEAGAITQHIGAYKVAVPQKEEPQLQATRESQGVPSAGSGGSGQALKASAAGNRAIRTITFLDTPGHEAFAAMRARGANVTDLIILVVAADDGVKQQTLEVVNRAKLTHTPLIVAINKIDKSEANIERVKKELSAVGIVPEEWGGKTIFVPISAKQNLGIDKLLDTILLVAEVENYQANPQGQTAGTLIEAHMSKTQGPIASIIIQNGTLKIGDAVGVGACYGRVRSLEDESGRKLKAASPSSPVRLSGLSALPEVGDILRVFASIQEAQQAARIILQARSAKRLTLKTGIATDMENQQLNLIIKADTHGSLEAILQEIHKLENQQIQIKVVSQGVGDINESDVISAESSKATIIGFHNLVSPAAARLAKPKKVNIDIYQIIYELTEDLTQAILKLILPEVEEVLVGQAKILAIFLIEKDYKIVGGTVQQGQMSAGKKVMIYRADRKIGEAKILELQQRKQTVTSVQNGVEFGVKLSTAVKLEKGDILKIIEERLREKQLKKLENR